MCLTKTNTNNKNKQPLRTYPNIAQIQEHTEQYQIHTLR